MCSMYVCKVWIQLFKRNHIVATLLERFSLYSNPQFPLTWKYALKSIEI